MPPVIQMCSRNPDLSLPMLLPVTATVFRAWLDVSQVTITGLMPMQPQYCCVITLCDPRLPTLRKPHWWII